MTALRTMGLGLATSRTIGNRRRTLRGVIGIHLFSLLVGLPLAAQEPTSTREEEVAEVARTFLSALSAADTATLGPLLAPGAMIYSVRDGTGGPALRAVTRAAFLESLGEEDQDLLERMWDPTVQLQDRVAMVWTPYDFHLER